MNAFRIITLVLSAIHGFANSASLDLNSDNFLNLGIFGRNAFIKPDTQVTEPLLANISTDFSQNPEELGPYFEGDILFPPQMANRNALLALNIRWPKNIVPVKISGNFSVDELAAIRWAFDQYHNRTCIRFKRHSRERDYISLENGNSGCWASIGRIGGKQVVNLQTPHCIERRGTILHEFMHALGFLHEHSRHDRDRYITIHKENIKENMMSAFEKISKQKAHGMGYGYDYTSVMHYSAWAFSKNGQPTIEAKMDTEESHLMGQRNDFSAADLARINVMYTCKNQKRPRNDNIVL